MRIDEAHSTRQCNTFWQDTVKNLQLTNVFKPLFFRRVLPYQTVCVLVATALPRRVRVNEIKTSAKFFGDFLMSGKFGPVVVCNRLYISFIWQQCVDPCQFVNSFVTNHRNSINV